MSYGRLYESINDIVAYGNKYNILHVIKNGYLGKSMDKPQYYFNKIYWQHNILND